MGKKITESDRVLGADARRQEQMFGHNPPSWVQDEGIWAKAKEAASKQDGVDDRFALITHIYKKMGGRIK